MSTLSSAREVVRAEASSFTFGRAIALLAGSVSVGVDALVNRAEIRKSRRQLAELDDRLLRDIGVDRGTARYESSKGFWA